MESSARTAAGIRREIGEPIRWSAQDEDGDSAQFEVLLVWDSLIRGDDHFESSGVGCGEQGPVLEA